MFRQALPTGILSHLIGRLESPWQQSVQMPLLEAIRSLIGFPSCIGLWVVSSVSLCGYLLILSVLSVQTQHTILMVKGRSNHRILFYQRLGPPVSNTSKVNTVANTMSSIPILVRLLLLLLIILVVYANENALCKYRYILTWYNPSFLHLFVILFYQGF